MSKANLANAILGEDLSAAATTVALVSGYGQYMPIVPFKLTLTPFGQMSTMGNSEVILVTERDGDTLTIERGKSGTTAKSFETGDIASNGVYVENSSSVGDIIMTMNEMPSAGRLFMDGQTYDKSDYPMLYQHVVSNPAYGTVTQTSFTLTDMSKRFPLARSHNGDSATLANTGGLEKVSLTAAQNGTHSHSNGTLSAASGGAHTHSNGTLTAASAGAHTHRVNHGEKVGSGSGVGGYWGGVTSGHTSATTSDGAHTHNVTGDTSSGGAHTHNVTGNTSDSGSGEAHENMPPWIVVNMEVITG